MIGPTFDMDALRAMVLGTELSSFTRAAAVLGRSQSAISLQLRKLEQQAGRPLFQRSGRGLVPTEAGETLLAYARRMIALNDEAAVALGAAVEGAAVRLGLPQDLFEDVMPEAVLAFERLRPGIHVEVRAGRNHALEGDVRAGRLDVALTFFPPGSEGHGDLAATLPLHWLSAEEDTADAALDPPLPLVLFDHPCLFRQAALRALGQAGIAWRLALTTPSLTGVWASVRAGHGLSVRTAHRVPPGVAVVHRDAGSDSRLPALPPIELRLLSATELSPAARDLHAVVADTADRLLQPV